MNERTAEATTVEEDGIHVEKSFTDDAFPVPAVLYELVSDREDAVRVRIVDRIPESFPMDRIGFHPDYESENWTAYKDHRVEFERVLEPGESVETVFGIRDENPDLESFLGAPVIEHVPVDEEIEDVLGTGETDAVREVLSGDRATLPGMEESEVPEAAEHDDPEPAQEAGQEVSGDDPTPREVTASSSSAVTRRERAEDDSRADVASDDELELDSDEEPTLDSEPDTDETDTDEGVTQLGDDESEPDEDGAEPLEDSEGTEPVTPGSRRDGTIAAALADEIRAGEVDDEDLALLRSELDIGVPRSVDVRISRLQSSVADIEAYADALAEFIDEEGIAREILDGIDARVDEVEDTVSVLDERVGEGERARDELTAELERVDGTVDQVEADVTDLESSVEAVDGDVSAVRDDVADVETEVGNVGETVSAVEETVHELKETVGGVVEDVAGVESELSVLDDAVDDLDDDIETLYEEVDDAAVTADRAVGRVDDVEDQIGRFDEEFDDVWDDLSEVDSRLTDVEGRLGDDLEDVDAELAEINEHLEELEAFRKRLNEAFGP